MSIQKSVVLGSEKHSTVAKPVNPNVVLAICCLSLFVISMDITIVNVALPAIQSGLHATVSQLQWIVDAYTLVLATLLILSGSLSDRYGRKLMFQIGMGLFALASLICSMATSVHGLIWARAIQGLGASMLNPVALSIIANVITEPKQRARAIGIWGAVNGLSFGIGPLIGGVLTQSVGWRAIFWINVPIGIAAILLTKIYIPESKVSRIRAYDPVGQILVFTILATLTYGLIEGPHAGWRSTEIECLFATTVVALVIFIVYELRQKEPLIDVRFFLSIPFSSATVLAVCAFSSLGGFLFLNTLYLQQIRGVSAFVAGFYSVPLGITLILTALVSGDMVGKYGTKPSVILAGSTFLGSSLLLTALSVGTPSWVLVLSYMLFGAGMGMINPAITNNAVAGMPLSQAGVAAATASTSRQSGSALGVAVAGTILAVSGTTPERFTHATHPIWWIIAGCSTMIIILGWVSNTAMAKESVRRVARLFEENH